jgi:peptidoglycan/xylan/chitin deacetylase (PgdA/CDA1 family)
VAASLSRRAFLVSGGALFGLVACSREGRPRARGPGDAPVTTNSARSVPAPVGSGRARFTDSGPTTERAIAFTFHGSGDLGLTQKLLDAARRESAPITVFAVGRWLDDHPEMATVITGAGHELANHTYTHPALGRVDRGDMAAEIARCRDALVRLSGSPGRWFRPSSITVPTTTMLEEAARAGYATVVGFDVDPRDYQDPGSSAILQRVSAALHPGAIVSLHTGHAGTVEAFGPMVAAARDQGLRPVLLRDLLATAVGNGR